MVSDCCPDWVGKGMGEGWDYTSIRSEESMVDDADADL